MNWRISKQFDFDFGHRVWTQKPDEKLSCGHQSVCRHLHGHRGTVHVWLTADELDETGMVTDFVNLGWFKKFLDSALDHKMVLDVNDPLLSHIAPCLNYKCKNVDSIYRIHKTGPHEFYTPNPEMYSDQPIEITEFYNGLVLVNFVPTSENISKWLYHIVDDEMKSIGVETWGLQFFETPKSQTIFTP